MGLTPAGLGHNGGPSMEGGVAWRTYAWTRAREALVPTLPLEVVRLRVRRAAELGLDYRTYAGVRASTGRDVIGFLYSTNALRLLRPTDAVPAAIRDRLAQVQGADRTALVQPPLDPAAVLALAPLDDARPAPRSIQSWASARDTLRAILAARGLPGDAVILVGETGAEREWAEAARLAAVLPAERVFGAPA